MEFPFSDTLNVVKSDGLITTSVYRKPTHCNRYLNFLSHHPIQHKTSVVKTLYTSTRAFLVNSDETNLIREEQHITHSLKSNGYSTKFLKEVKKKIKCETTRNTPEIKKELKVLRSCHILKAQQKLKRVLQSHNIRVAIKPVSIFKNYLMRPKDDLLNPCETKYIGETGRSLETRQKEHLRSVYGWQKQKIRL